jgi:hypothetical protein
MHPMRPRVLAALLFLAACSRAAGPAAPALPADALDQAIGGAIGDPTTCVILADPASGKALYRYGELFNCQRPLPACDRPGTLTAETALPLAAMPDGRHASCPSSPDGSRSVGWAQGRVVGARRDLIFSAVMEGDRALPGEEMTERLADVFRNVGL